jgi:hypothetical protein
MGINRADTYISPAGDFPDCCLFIGMFNHKKLLCGAKDPLPGSFLFSLNPGLL